MLRSGELRHSPGPGLPHLSLVTPGWVPDSPEWTLFPTLCFF